MSTVKTYLSDIAQHEGRIEQAYQIHRASTRGADRPSFEAGYEAACSFFWNLPPQPKEYSEFNRLMDNPKGGR